MQMSETMKMTWPMSNFFIYLGLMATAHNPAVTEDEITAAINTIVPQASEYERVLQVAQELARAGGGELHNISALTGGMVAQEAIKMITKQYVPANGYCVVDLVDSWTGTVGGSSI